MKKTLSQIQYNRLLALYYKLKDRLNRHFSLGRFREFTKKQQNKLLSRIEDIKAQLYLLRYQAKLGGITLVVGTSLYATQTNAQFALNGSEFKVNTYTTGSQFNASIASDSLGDFVITWDSNLQDGSYYGVYAQRYDVSGIAQGPEFRVNTYTTNSQYNPSIAMDRDGDFVISWTSRVQDGSYYGVYAQRYNALGVAQGSEFKVNSYTTNVQSNSSVAMDNSGNFVISWVSHLQDGSGYGIYAQRYNALGVSQGSEFKVNTYTTNDQYDPSIAMDSDGDFVISWVSNLQDGNKYGIYAQRYNSSGVSQGSEFLVNTYTTDNQYAPSVAMDEDGDFVISWTSKYQDGYGYGVYAQRYNASGVAQNSEFLVNTYTMHGQASSSVGMDRQGDFVITWCSNLQDGDNYGVYAKRYNAFGVIQGSEFLVNTYTTNSQRNPSIGMNDVGDFVISWNSNTQDGSSNGIYAQQYIGGFTLLTAIEGQTTEVPFYLYPNPSKGQVQISLEGQFVTRILDLSGHTLKEETHENNTLNIEGLKAGVYMVEVNQNGRKGIKKLVVE